MADSNGPDYSKYIIPVGIVIGGVVIASKLGLFSKGALSTGNDKLTADEKATAAAAIAALKQQGINPTSTDAQLQSLASQLWSLGTSEDSAGSHASGSVEDDMIEAFENIVNNAADLYTVKNYFGTKSAATSTFSMCAFFGLGCQVYNLDSFLKLALDDTHIEELNNYLQQQGINYAF